MTGMRTLGAWLLLFGFGFTAVPAQGYLLLNSRRPNATYHFDVGLSLSASTTSPSGPTWDSAYADAAAKWNAASPLVHLSVTQGSAHDPCNTSDGIHTAQFVPDVCTTPFGGSTLAIARRWKTGAYTIDGSIHFKDSVNWDVYTGPLKVGPRDFRRVAVHELGHLLGLDHESVATSIMAPTISNLEDPQTDDVNGITAIYNLGCPIYHNVGAGTVNGALAITDCFDTEDGPLPLPNGGGTLPHSSSTVADPNAFVDLYRVSMPSGGTIEATLSSSAFNPVVQILDSTASTELGIEWKPTGQSAVLSTAVGAGTYIVVARNVFEGQIGSYTLTLVPEPSRGAMALAAFVTVFLLRMLRMRHHAAAHGTQ